jgi:hypothetical protein
MKRMTAIRRVEAVSLARYSPLISRLPRATQAPSPKPRNRCCAMVARGSQQPGCWWDQSEEKPSSGCREDPDSAVQSARFFVGRQVSSLIRSFVDKIVFSMPAENFAPSLASVTARFLRTRRSGHRPVLVTFKRRSRADALSSQLLDCHIF